MCDAHHGVEDPHGVLLSPNDPVHSPSKEQNMTEVTSETIELRIEELDRVSGGDMAIDLAVKAYEALGQRLVDAVHQPVTSQPTMSLHMR
jgi:hypothetical protein